MATSNAPASKSGLYADPREDWLAQRKEEILDSSRPIVDPHHHLWDRGGQRYMIEEMAADIASGHNIIATVYVDCRSMYRASGPEASVPPRSAPTSSATSIYCWATARGPSSKRKSPRARGVFAASGIPRHGTPKPESRRCTPRGQRACCSIRPSARDLPASRNWA